MCLIMQAKALTHNNTTAAQDTYPQIIKRPRQHHSHRHKPRCCRATCRRSSVQRAPLQASLQNAPALLGQQPTTVVTGQQQAEMIDSFTEEV